MQESRCGLLLQRRVEGVGGERCAAERLGGVFERPGTFFAQRYFLLDGFADPLYSARRSTSRIWFANKVHSCTTLLPTRTALCTFADLQAKCHKPFAKRSSKYSSIMVQSKGTTQRLISWLWRRQGGTSKRHGRPLHNPSSISSHISPPSTRM
jgi:hypothetical protein